MINYYQAVCCVFTKELKYPGLPHSTESGGMDGEMLCEIFRRIDYLGLCDIDREKGYIYIYIYIYIYTILLIG